MSKRSANRRGWATELEPPMRVRAQIIESCRQSLEPEWKRRLRKLYNARRARSLGLHAVGEGVHLGPNLQMPGSWLGDYSSVGHSAEFNGPVIIGDLTMLSSSVQVIGNDHVADDPTKPMRLNFPETQRPVTVIEADCWIGSRVTIMEGVRIRRGTVVAAGAVVSKSTEAYSIIGGVPARTIRSRFGKDEQAQYDALLYGEVPSSPMSAEMVKPT